MQTPTSKPVLPHYSPTRRELWGLVTTLRAQADEAERLDYHRNAIRQGEAEAMSLREQANAVEKAARALGGFDKAGIVVEPSTEPVPPHSVRLAC